MFNKILVANRGVIAHRILKTLKAQGIASVAIFTPGDEKSLHVTDADESICIRSYTEIPEIMSVSKQFKVEAIHPGVGFLSENIDFAQVANHSSVFVGPNISLFTKMGNKVKARKIAEQAGLPTIPGSEGPLRSDREAAKVADSIGYPIILKAAEGGGGMGMEIADDENELLDAFPKIRAQAKTLFGSEDVFLEKLIQPNRHIEVQVLADNHGNVVHFGERDCSIQRRHQKLIEFSPADISEDLRTAITDAAVKLTRAVRYSNAGTVEFLVDDAENFYFMEMNTRIQVEHRVSEMVWERDLIREQFRCAAGEELGYDQNDIQSKGFALECRINAEDPKRDFEASPGKIGRFMPPTHRNIQIDTFIPVTESARKGYQISTAYDSLLANVIAWGKDKEAAINIMRKTLKEFEIEGKNVKTTIPFHLDKIGEL